MMFKFKTEMQKPTFASVLVEIKFFPSNLNLNLVSNNSQEMSFKFKKQFLTLKNYLSDSHCLILNLNSVLNRLRTQYVLGSEYLTTEKVKCISKTPKLPVCS
jgi:hypothetical protein